MYLKQHTKLCVMHAISPVSAGAGSATGAIDLPIQREHHTGWPHIQASGVKGAFRDHCERVWMLKDLAIDTLVTGEKKARALDLAKRVFGRSDAEKSQAGAIAFSDAKLLAFPVRSNLAPFVWVVCPALLQRLARDLALTSIAAEALGTASVTKDCYGLIKGELSGSLILEDICLNRQEDCSTEGINEIFDRVAPTVDRLVLIPDQHFTFLMETATEVQAQISIDASTGTTKDGSLRYQELLPADSVLYTVVFFGEERAEESNRIVLETLNRAVQEAAASHIQIGGDLTLGRGIFQIDWLPSAGGAS